MAQINYFKIKEYANAIQDNQINQETLDEEEQKRRQLERKWEMDRYRLIFENMKNIIFKKKLVDCTVG